MDHFILGLACAGIAVTGATYATLGGGLPERLGLSLVKSLAKTGRLTRQMTAWITRSARETVDTAALGAAVTKASFTAPAVALRAARDAVKLERAEGLVSVARDVSKVQAKAGTKAALEGVQGRGGTEGRPPPRPPRRSEGRQDPRHSQARRPRRLCADRGASRPRVVDRLGGGIGTGLRCHGETDHRARHLALHLLAQGTPRAGRARRSGAGVTPRRPDALRQRITRRRVQVGWTHWNEPMCFVHSGARFG